MKPVKFDAGPWKHEQFGYRHVITAPRSGYVTREVCTMDGSTMQAFWHEGNAMLIAASPELLDALKNLEWACTGVDYMENEYGKELAVARALLARFGLGSGL